MGRPIGPKKVHRYSVEFKLTAVKLSGMPGVQVQTVADALDIHPFMRSRWRKEARDGVLRGRGRRVEGGPRRAQAAAGARARARDAAGRARAFKKSHPVLFRTKAEVFAFIDGQRGSFPVKRMCVLYGVTRVGYYAWRHRGESARRRRDRSFVGTIRGLFEQSWGTYGSPRIHRVLVASGERVSRRRVERLMREAGLRARAVTLYRRIPGLHGFFSSIPNHQRDRLAMGPDQVWVGDITYLKVAGAWRYLAVVMDRYSRRVLGWSLGPKKDARLTLRALNHAVVHRHPRPGVIFHSDRGVEYAAYAFRHRLAALGFVQSMNRPREVTDNAHMESFFHSMKSDAVHGIRFRHHAEIERLVRRYIPYYNGVRLHSGIGYSSPVDYEALAT